MILKALELNGFKSFAQKTTIDLRHGITAIVGPNGSGKSNIIDAVRWLLGEREAKNLRGGKSEDLLFAGTPTKPRASLGSVSIHLDNNARTFSAEFTDVVVQRQVSRTGESRYFLNESEVRLKDAVDLFAKSRLGAQGLIVINQGDSDLFITSSPEERREMIEEILGLKEYQMKKGQAERKLEATADNLAQARIRIEELTPRLRLLKRQTAKWERRGELEEELRGLQATLAARRHAAVRASLATLDGTERQIASAIAMHADTVQTHEKTLAAITKPNGAALAAIRGDQERLLAKRSTLEKELGKIEFQLEAERRPRAAAHHAIPAGILLGVVRDIRNRLAELLSSAFTTDDIRSLIGHIDASLEAQPANAALTNLHADHERITAAIAACNAGIADFRAREAELAAGLETFNARFSAAFSAAERAKAELRDHETRVADARADRARLMEELNALPRVDDAVVATFADMPVADAERRAMRLETELAIMGQVDQELVKECNETEERHTFLETQARDLESAAENLRALVADLEKKIGGEFTAALAAINEEFRSFIHAMFNGGTARLAVAKKPAAADTDEEDDRPAGGIDVAVTLPGKRITGLDMLSGGERSLVSIAALFALISVSPPPFLVFDEIDAALDERNARRFASLIGKFSKKTQFVIVTHNRATMEVANALYGVTMENGVSKLVSLKLEPAGEIDKEATTP
ncbi:MAG: AAA family ATPase [Candidatus Liptonbacteria bacterium]|nr:AAA family ATPase [Candidatus Liptonbacteria bacterium]